MRLTDRELISKKYTKFAQSFTNNAIGTAEEIQENLDDSFGGIVHNGRLGWLAKGPYFEIFSLKNGHKIGKFRFDNNLGFERSIITSICEIEANDFNGCLLAIGIQFGDAPGGIIAIYSVQGSKVLRCIEIPDKVTSCHYIGTEITKRTILQMMQGCLAVGTDIGKIILLDLSLLKCEEALFSTIGNEDDIVLVPCHLVHSKLDFTHIREHYKHSIQQNVNFGIELEVVERGGLVLSLLSIPPSLCLVAGLEDGRMILYDLSELQPFHLAFPPENLSPLVKLSYLEPPDDPRPCIYLWAYHENSQNAIAVMHSIVYDKKLLEDDEFYLFEDFQSCYVRLTLPMFDNHSLPICCRSITKFPSNGNEEIISLCLLSWKSENYTQILIFDLNQWYKEEMPNIGDWRKNLSYVAAFRLNHCLPFDIFLDSNTIALFNSIQRSEEHFYPISLSFDCVLLMPKGSSYLHWPGLQNRALDILNTAGSLAILEPSPYFNEIMTASLMPQFCDYNYNSTFTINVQREILLSVALEYNCFGLLKECAKNWADGSHLGKNPSEGLSLSTLTDWAWQRASFIKNRCNTLCVSLFDHSGYQIDQRNQKELSYLSRQLKLLANLLDIILIKCKDYIPSQVIDNLSSQYNSVRMASEYQEVLQWLLNVGLLPEGAGSHNSESMDNDGDNNSIITSQLVPYRYPYRALKNYYMAQRMRFYKMNKATISPRTQSCRVLYIDSFIEHECNPNALREQWLESGGNGLYPPPSLQAMLRTLLVPEVPLEKKYVLFIYLFLDLNMAVTEERHAAIVQNLIKFPAVFKLNASLIKTVQAFWNLDHGQFEVALEEIISPFSQDKKLLQWQQELLIESLISQDQSNYALRALQARSSPINTLLEIKTLMANDLIAEAFHLARSKNDVDLLKTFFSGCLYLGKWCILRDLALTDEEGKIVAELFKESKSSKAGNLHFIYLLQKSKYVEALTYLDELALSHRAQQNQKTVDLETPQLILSAYNVTMTPATKSLADCYHKIRNRISAISENNDGNTINENTPKPLSCQLLKQNANNLYGGVYQSSAISVDLATNYWDELKLMDSEKHINHLLDSNNAPFVRKPQPDAYIDIMPPIKDNVSYPEIYKAAQKRRLGDDDSFIFEKQQINDNDILENPQKRRRFLETNDTLLTLSMKNNNLPIKQSLNSSLLTKFKDKKINTSINFMDKTSSANMTPNQNSTDRSPVLLDTPIVKSCRTDYKDNNSNDQFDMRSDRVLTPQSILKVKNLIRSETPINKSRTTIVQNLNQEQISSSNASEIEENHSENSTAVGDEEKSIRFELPIEKKSSLSIKTDDNIEHLHVKEHSHIKKHLHANEHLANSKTSPTCRYSCPQKRKSIRSADSSILSETSVDEFFSPLSSRDNSRLDSGNNSTSQINIIEIDTKKFKNDDMDEIMDTSELTPKRLNYKEISKDSGADVCTSTDISSASTSNNRSPFVRYDGPKTRRPLSPSKTPPEIRNIIVADGSLIHNEPKLTQQRSSRSKTPEIKNVYRDRSPIHNEPKLTQRHSSPSKTPDILLSPSRRSERLSTKFQRETTPEKQLIQTIAKQQSTQKTLSRIVLESNTIKNIMSSVVKFDDKSIQKLEEKLDEQTNELHKEITLLKSETEEFQPLISSSKVAATTTSMFSDSKNNETTVQNRTSEYSTVDGEISFNDSESDIMSKTFAQHIATPKPFLPADISMVTDGYVKKIDDRNQSLMTTMDMSNISFNYSMFGQPENILSDSSMEEIKTNVEKNDNLEKTDKQDDVEVTDVIIENKDELIDKIEDDEPKTYKNINIPILDYSGIKICDEQIVIAESDSSSSSNSSENDEIGIQSDPDINTDLEDDDDGIELGNEEDNESENDDLNNYVEEEQSTNDTTKSSNKLHENSKSNDYPASDDDDDQNLVINISSTSSESENLIKSQSLEDVSDLLYGDIDNEIIEQENTDIEMQEDYNQLNNEEIYRRSEAFSTDTPITTKTGNLKSSNTFNSDGINMNFLTGENDEEQVNLNDGRLEATSTKLCETNIINESEIDVHMSENPLNLPILGDTTSNISIIEKSHLKDNENNNTELDTTVEVNSTIEIDTTYEDANDSVNILNQAIVDDTTSKLNTSKNIVSVNVDDFQSEDIKEKINSVESINAQSNSTETSKIDSEIINKKTDENTINSDDNIQLKVSDDDEYQNTEFSSVGIDTEKTINISNNNKIILENQQSNNNNSNLLETSTVTPQSKYNLRRLRTESIDKDNIITDSPIKRNISRATSVPIESSDSSTPKNKLRKRSESIDCNSLTPKQIITRRRSTLLEQIEENSPFDVPAQRTRSRLRLDSIDSDKTDIFEGVAGPSTSTTTPMSSKRGRKISTGSGSIISLDDVTKTPRSTRAKSILSEDNTQTPRRISRRLSLAKDSPIKEESEKIGKKIIFDNESEKSVKKKSKSNSGGNSKKSDKVKHSTSKEIIEKIDIKESDGEISPQKDTDNVEEYAVSRRLTRTQKNVMEKSITIAAIDPKTVPLKKRQPKTTKDYSIIGDERHKGDGISDTESIVSQKSKKSVASSAGAAARRATRSTVKEYDDEAVSITSSTKSSKSLNGKKKTSTKKVKESVVENLTVIPEEDQENEEYSNASSDNESPTVLPPRKKGRPRSKKI